MLYYNHTKEFDRTNEDDIKAIKANKMIHYKEWARFCWLLSSLESMWFGDLTEV